MKKLSILLMLWFSTSLLANQAFDDRELQVFAKHYQLNYQLDFVTGTLSAEGEITIANNSATPADHVPFRLYRMLKVSEITDNSGNPINFQQQILSNDHWREYQSNYVEIKLDKPIKPNSNYTFKVKFDGPLKGYTEVGQLYVKDSINDEFSIIRMDTMAYPLFTYPNDKVNRKSLFWLSKYDYDVSVTVPTTHVVANVGELVELKTKGEKSTYRFKSKLPAWRMDFTVAKYQVKQSGKYKIYSWESEDKIDKLMKETSDTFDLYTKWFGELKQKIGYTIIQIPDTYGSQADLTGIIQEGDAFNHKESLTELYHEVSHQWNVKPTEESSPRWSEGLASFLQVLTYDHLQKSQTMESSLNGTIESLKKRYVKNQKYRETPYLNYGKEGLSAYSVGKVFFKVMYDLLGEKEFNKIIGGYYHQYVESGSTTEDFIKYVKKNASVNLDKLFEDWAYTTNYVKLIESSKSYQDIIKAYR